MTRWNEWPDLAAVGGEGHAHGKGRAVLLLPQRAEIVGDALRQHRHDAVGEIDRVAALQRLAVERRIRQHIGGDVGDRDGGDEAAGVLLVRIRLGEDGVVVILGVGRIDGHQRQLRASPRGRPWSPAWPPRPRRSRPAGKYAGCRARGWRSSRPPSRWSASPAPRSPCRAAGHSGRRAPARPRRGRHPWRRRVNSGSTISSGCRRSTGSIRNVPSLKRAEHAEHGIPALLEDLDDAAGIGRP